MICANIDAFRQIEGFPSKTSAAQMSGVNDDCYVHYYIYNAINICFLSLSHTPKPINLYPLHIHC